MTNMLFYRLISKTSVYLPKSLNRFSRDNSTRSISKLSEQKLIFGSLHNELDDVESPIDVHTYKNFTSLIVGT